MVDRLQEDEYRGMKCGLEEGILMDNRCLTSLAA
jgi:hypothetical protein